MEYSTYLSFEFWLRYFEKYKTAILAVAIALGLAVGTITYWFISKSKQEELACSTLTELMQEAGRARQNNELWSELEISARTAYSQYKSTNVAPYFLALQAETYIQQDKNAEAIATMKEMMGKISSSSPLYSAYAIKEARLLMDSSDELSKNEGMEKLTQLAHNTKNSLRDEAYYYLGSYYLALQDIDSAKNAFNKAIEIMASQQTDYPSPWVQLAHAKLQEIS